MAGLRLRRVDDYGLRLHRAMAEIAPQGVDDPQVVLLSPGIYNSAYFEHVFLAREMGVPLVEGRDLVVEDDRVWMRTTAGLAPVHTIYRRHRTTISSIPTCSARTALLGVRGLIERVAPRQRGDRQRGRHRRRRRQGGLCLHAAHHPLLPSRGADPAECRDPYLPRAGRRWPTRWTIWTNWWSSRSANPAATASSSARAPPSAQLEDFRARADGRPGQLHQPADAALSVSPTLTEHGRRAAPRRSAPVRGDRARHLGAARRPDAGRAAGGHAGGEFVAGRRLEGHLGAGMSGDALR